MNDLLTLAEAAEFLRLGPGAAYRKVANRELPALRINGRGKLLFLLSELENCLKRCDGLAGHKKRSPVETGGHAESETNPEIRMFRHSR